MSRPVDLYICGSQTEQPSAYDANFLNVHSVANRPLDRLSTAEVNDYLHTAESDLVGFVDSRLVDRLGNAGEFVGQIMDDDSPAALILGNDASASDWQIFPQPIAALIRPIAENAVVFVRKSHLDRHGRLADVADPLWEWLVRSVNRGEKIQVREEPARSGSGTSMADEGQTLPKLAPKEPGRSRQWLRNAIDSLDPRSLTNDAIPDTEFTALKAGLLQIHDYLDASHQHSQSIEHEGRYRDGNYWHAIMHRREPDYGNSKYWFRNVGDHPIFPQLAEAAQTIGTHYSATDMTDSFAQADWDPFAFVDFCQHCARTGDAKAIRIAEEVQWQEMQLLLEHTYREAGG
ncbi:hypothetical protein [Thalassoroseus pseudoceratinae]|uniref:hypothetical protein n=1 Tax=Thalassoroseus pseudoceratinae TaxID=2713176 RepID=UPI00141D7803|nr:hypothetical protein [Thalassoroseus pseudoceratinae]